MITLESDLQSDIIELAHGYGWFAEKVVSKSRRGFPDVFLARNGVVMLIEVKRKGEEARRQQEKRHKELRAKGVTVHLVDNLMYAKRLLV